ncbi:uncharacterized protein IL334_001834 [Kwoniella shivajii]|uniref:BZIP domain-containing protein n=1 Tax=Kwoniella shivajii TaxID=564305 RepID=A0ABZ1CUL2_9TREE|nr:hypothetical protein IL334_001834 [Kwoniella shivajii]
MTAATATNTTTTTINAVASSSKRPLPSSSKRPLPSSPSPAQANKAKRPRPSTSTQDDDEDEEEDNTVYDNVDDELKAKIARKEARTIRNRESAQRSRNQRKAHLAYLEQRVVELENENRVLKGDSQSPSKSQSPSTPCSFISTTNGREASPAQSVISLANDLGIPSELVNGTGGVKLSNVAPPPRDLELEDVKPIIDHSPSPVSKPNETDQHIGSDDLMNPEVNKLKSENAALRERISLLENLVKQVVAVANFSGLSGSDQQDQKPIIVEQPEISPIQTNNSMIDWSSFISAPVNIPPPTSEITTGLEATLSPPFYPATLTNVSEPIIEHNSIPNLSSSVESNLNPVTRHPAEVATLSCVFKQQEKALQRFYFQFQPQSQNQFQFNSFNNMFNNQNELQWGESNANGNNSYTATTTTSSMENNWDEAMKNLIEDIEGRNGRDEIENNQSVLGMEWYGNANGSGSGIESVVV